MNSIVLTREEALLVRQGKKTRKSVNVSPSTPLPEGEFSRIVLEASEKSMIGCWEYKNRNGTLSYISAPFYKGEVIDTGESAARQFLRVTNCRPQELFEITEEQAAKEGFKDANCCISYYCATYPPLAPPDWCWAVDFEIIKEI